MDSGLHKLSSEDSAQIARTQAGALAVTLDPYTKEVAMLTDQGLIVCSYREAVDNPNLFRYLTLPTVETINTSLDAQKMVGDR